MSKFSLLICFFFLLAKANAQNLELDKVTKEQLKEKVHPSDTSAAAAFLFKKARTVFVYSSKEGFSSKTEFSIKLKIYKKEGFNWANFEIPYYVGYENLNKEQVAILKAYTYNLEDGKIIKQKVSGESKFKEKVNENWETKIITFPNVKEGSILELKYEFKSENLSELPAFQFQYKIPLDYAIYTTEIPGFYLYQAIKTGFVDVTINDRLENTTFSFEDEYHRSSYINCQQIKTIYEVANVKALTEENYVSNMKNYFGKIENELKTIQFPKEPIKQIASSWESVAKSIFEEKSFGAELNKYSYFLEDLKRITDKTESKLDRLKAIFDFVKNRMNWNGKKGYYTKVGVETAYSESSGNVAEINLILASMLKNGGLDAAPVLLSTRDNGVPMFPNRSKFNYVIVAVNLDNQQFLLDATEKYATISNLPIRDLNDKGRLINADGTSIEINLMPKYNSDHTLNLLAKIDSLGEVTGQVREQYFDYNGLKYRSNYSGISEESYIEKIEKKYPGLEIDNFKVKNDKLVYEPIEENYNIHNKNTVEIIGDKMFFSPMFHLALEQNPFKQELREFPVDFSFPNKEKYIISLSIPDGYQVESMPKSIAISMDKGYGNFSLTTSNTNNQLQINVVLNINTSIIPAEDYGTLKEFYKVIMEKETEKIVIKKI